MKRILLISVILTAMLLSACAAPVTTPESTATEKPSTIQQAPSPDKEAPPAGATLNIPADVSYEVINTDILPGIKRSLDVRLNKRVSEDVLRAIALKLKSDDSRQYDRTFILYYLPNMAVGSGAWATTHFDPTLVIDILGLTIQEEQALVTEPTPSNLEVIGSWLDNWTTSRIDIYRENSVLYLEYKFEDGSSLKQEVVENSSPLGQRFDKKGGSSSGDHWIIDREGNLQLRDNLGLVSMAKRIQ